MKLHVLMIKLIHRLSLGHLWFILINQFIIYYVITIFNQQSKCLAFQDLRWEFKTKTDRRMRKLIFACVTIGVAVGAGVWIYKRWKQDNEKGSFEDEVRLLNRKNKNRQTKKLHVQFAGTHSRSEKIKDVIQKRWNQTKKLYRKKIIYYLFIIDMYD